MVMIELDLRQVAQLYGVSRSLTTALKFYNDYISYIYIYSMICYYLKVGAEGDYLIPL
jgi:hypothetical protein